MVCSWRARTSAASTWCDDSCHHLSREFLCQPSIHQGFLDGSETKKSLLPSFLCVHRTGHCGAFSGFATASNWSSKPWSDSGTRFTIPFALAVARVLTWPALCWFGWKWVVAMKTSGSCNWVFVSMWKDTLWKDTHSPQECRPRSWTIWPGIQVPGGPSSSQINRHWTVEGRDFDIAHGGSWMNILSIAVETAILGVRPGAFNRRDVGGGY